MVDNLSWIWSATETTFPSSARGWIGPAGYWIIAAIFSGIFLDGHPAIRGQGKPDVEAREIAIRDARGNCGADAVATASLATVARFEFQIGGPHPGRVPKLLSLTAPFHHLARLIHKCAIKDPTARTKAKGRSSPTDERHGPPRAEFI